MRMLTYDDLDHFDEKTMAGLFALQSAEEQSNAIKRRERILACLRFCRDVGFEELPEAGVHTARRLLKRALRNQQRSRRMQPELIEDFLQGALRALGEPCGRTEEAAEVAALRHSVEREIETAAVGRLHGATRAPILLDVLACGDFEISAESDLASLDEIVGKFNGRAEIDLELVLDGNGSPDTARVHLVVACSLWHWSVLDGCSVTFDEAEPLSLHAGDELIPVLLAGVSAQGGRALAMWAQAVHAQQLGHLN
jgi:hypothetical protein